MLRYFHLTTALSITLISLLPEVVFSRPLPMVNPYPVVPNSNSDVLVCYLQTEDGDILDLRKLCDKTPQATNIQSNSSSSAGTCYFIDANGRPCVSLVGERQEESSINLVKTSVPESMEP